MKGYKATDANMRCRGFQFKLGEWHEHDGPLVECESGFHFCEYPSGPWSYYLEPGTRIFEVEVYDVLEKRFEAGADLKRVARRIRLVKEITPGDSHAGDHNTVSSNTGSSNTGSYNTGSYNTGSRNAGSRNTGNRNTGSGNTGSSNTGVWNAGNGNVGDYNTGSYNAGSWNAGSGNTGISNTGISNTGSWNTGNNNAGDYNTGSYNTGSYNTGSYNTGSWNASFRCAGFFGLKEPTVISFDIQTKLTYLKFLQKYPESYSLGAALMLDEPIDWRQFKRIPGITASKLKKLHAAFIKSRKDTKK